MHDPIFRLDSVLEGSQRQERRGLEAEARSQELREKVAGLEEEVAVVRSRAREERIHLEARLEEVEEEREGEQGRAGVRERALEERIRRLVERREEEEEGDRVTSLENSLAEVEEEKGALQLRLVDLEDLQGELGW